MAAMRRLPIPVLSIIVLALSACGSGANSDGDLTVTGEAGGEGVRLDLPGSGAPAALALWFHGQGGDADTRMNEDWLNTLRAAGWAVASGDLGGNSWGSPDAVAAAGALQAWAEDQSGAPTRLLVAGSMGGLTSLNALGAGEVESPCWYGTMPVVDPATVGNVPDSAEQIAAAWGGEVPSAPSDLPAIRYRVLASPDDEWVPKVSNADALPGLVPEGAEVTVVEVSGPHGDPSHFDAADLAAFAASCA